MRYLGQARIDMSTLLAGSTLPGFEGISLPSHERDAFNFDEAQSFLKYSLCQIELDRQAGIAKRYDADGHVTRVDMPDVWQPLREMTENLLPHLLFHRIDVSNREQIQCLWRVHNKDVLVDIDDLSSGEKSIIQLFFPLIEHQIQARLATISGAEASLRSGTVAVLMDEPELHLHPNLQGKVLDYIRNLTLSEGTQFILATHSPTMVEQANSDELYLLRPAELVGTDENQLVKVATDGERLQVLRDVFGSTSNITALRKILVVEGRDADEESRRPSDSRIYGFLSDRFGQLTIVSGGGKGECKILVQRLTQLLQTFAPHLSAVALLDRDVEERRDDGPNVLYLPVSMIENLLIDPAVIWDAITTVRHKTLLKGVAEVEAALDLILDDLEMHEVSRRVKAGIGGRTFRLKDPVTEARKQVEEFTTALLGDLSGERLTSLEANAQATVKKVKADTRRRELFDGKRVLDEFHSRHIHPTGMSKEIFVYECARQASKRQSVAEFVSTLFATLGINERAEAQQPS